MARRNPDADAFSRRDGWYQRVNSRLVRLAGPASVGPYEKAPEPVRTERPCPLCGSPMSAHTFDRSGPKPLMFCP